MVTYTLPHETLRERPKRHAVIRQDKELRERLSEKDLDKELKDSFPASDSTAKY